MVWTLQDLLQIYDPHVSIGYLIYELEVIFMFVSISLSIFIFYFVGAFNPTPRECFLQQNW